MGIVFYLVFFGGAAFIAVKSLYKEFMKSTEAGYKTSVPSSRQQILYKDSIYRDKASTYIGQGMVDGKFTGKYVGGGPVTDVGNSSFKSPQQKRQHYSSGAPVFIYTGSHDTGCAHHCHSSDCHHSQ